MAKHRSIVYLKVLIPLISEDDPDWGMIEEIFAHASAHLNNSLALWRETPKDLDLPSHLTGKVSLPPKPEKQPPLFPEQELTPRPEASASAPATSSTTPEASEAPKAEEPAAAAPTVEELRAELAEVKELQAELQNELPDEDPLPHTAEELDARQDELEAKIEAAEAGSLSDVARVSPDPSLEIEGPIHPQSEAAGPLPDPAEDDGAEDEEARLGAEQVVAEAAEAAGVENPLKGASAAPASSQDAPGPDDDQVVQQRVKWRRRIHAAASLEELAEIEADVELAADLYPENRVKLRTSIERRRHLLKEMAIPDETPEASEEHYPWVCLRCGDKFLAKAMWLEHAKKMHRLQAEPVEIEIDAETYQVNPGPTDVATLKRYLLKDPSVDLYWKAPEGQPDQLLYDAAGLVLGGAGDDDTFYTVARQAEALAVEEPPAESAPAPDSSRWNNPNGFPYTCTTCAEKFEKSGDLFAHQAEKHPKPPKKPRQKKTPAPATAIATSRGFECFGCRKAFPTAEQVIDHEKVCPDARAQVEAEQKKLQAKKAAEKAPKPLEEDPDYQKVIEALRAPENKYAHNMEIARACGTTGRFVAKVRASLESSPAPAAGE
jgi:hypothetical protein